MILYINPNIRLLRPLWPSAQGPGPLGPGSLGPGVYHLHPPSFSFAPSMMSQELHATCARMCMHNTDGSGLTLTVSCNFRTTRTITQELGKSTIIQHQEAPPRRRPREPKRHQRAHCIISFFFLSNRERVGHRFEWDEPFARLLR